MTGERGVLVVTGGSRGIGAKLVEDAAMARWSVCFTYLDSVQRAAALERKVRNLGGRVSSVQADIASESDVLRVFDHAESLGAIRGFVANAAIVAPPARVVNYEVARIRRILEVNVLGTIVCCREAVRRMSTKTGHQGGSIVLVSSAASRIGSAGEYVDYAATKGAIDSLTIGLAREVIEDGIRVNAVRPGTTKTEIHERNGQHDRIEQISQLIPARRAAQPSEISEAILWLLSEQASYCVGTLLDVAGGR